jgi:hypothetical protein
MKEKNKKSSKITFISIGDKFKKSSFALKVGFVANALAVLAFIFTILRMFSIFAVIAVGIFTVISILAYGVLFIETLAHRD